MEHGTFQEYQARLRVENAAMTCPVGRTLRLFQGKWAIRVLFELSKTDTVRFGALKQRVEGITNTMLTSTLRQLEENGLVRREQFNEVPPHVEYALTEAGRDLYPIFIEIGRWGERYLRRRRGWAPERFVPVRDSGEPAPYSGRMPPRRCGGTTAPPPG